MMQAVDDWCVDDLSIVPNFNDDGTLIVTEVQIGKEHLSNLWSGVIFDSLLFGKAHLLRFQVLSQLHLLVARKDSSRLSEEHLDLVVLIHTFCMGSFGYRNNAVSTDEPCTKSTTIISSLSL